MPPDHAGPLRVADRCALLMMLHYVETECRRLGVPAAAEHAALAAALMAEEGSPRPVPIPAVRPAH